MAPGPASPLDALPEVGQACPPAEVAALVAVGAPAPEGTRVGGLAPHQKEKTMATGYKLRDEFEAWVNNPHKLNRRTELGYADEYEHPWTCGALQTMPNAKRAVRSASGRFIPAALIRTTSSSRMPRAKAVRLHPRGTLPGPLGAFPAPLRACSNGRSWLVSSRFVSVFYGSHGRHPGAVHDSRRRKGVGGLKGVVLGLLEFRSSGACRAWGS